MMSSTFTTFDMMVTGQSQPSFSYIYGLLPAAIFFQSYWMTAPSRLILLTTIMSISSTLIKSTNNSLFKSAMMILVPTFSSIIILNLYGAAPYTITMTSHLMTTLSTGLPMWFTLMLVALMIGLKLMSAHLLPENTPKPIASFLSLVETLSTYIRPITLSFRLSANISAGHVILGMMTSSAVFTAFTMLTLILIPIIISGGYSMFEMAICLVQAFVFTLLASMYSNDYLTTKN